MPSNNENQEQEEKCKLHQENPTAIRPGCGCNPLDRREKEAGAWEDVEPFGSKYIPEDDEWWWDNKFFSGPGLVDVAGDIDMKTIVQEATRRGVEEGRREMAEDIENILETMRARPLPNYQSVSTRNKGYNDAIDILLERLSSLKSSLN